MDIKTAIRKAMKELDLSTVTYEKRPSYPNSYRWTPPGMKYTVHFLERKGASGRIMHTTGTGLSRDKRSFGTSTCIVRGIPTIQSAGKDKERAAVIRRAKARIEACGYSC